MKTLKCLYPAYIFCFLLCTIIPCKLVEAQNKCDIAAVEEYSKGNHKAMIYVATELRQYSNIGVVIVKDLSDLGNKVKQQFSTGGCDCINNLYIAGFGGPGIIMVGGGQKVGSDPNKYITGTNEAQWKGPLGNLKSYLCKEAQVWLLGSRVGHCNSAPDLLYKLAQTFDATVKAPVDMLITGEIVDYMQKGRWQTATPSSKPSHQSTLRDVKAILKQAKAEDEYYCPCNESVFSDIQECTNGCSTSLSCFSNICDSYYINNTWDKYSGNPVMLAGAAGSWDESGISNPSVLRASPYAMWYTGWDLTDVESIGYATSDDGFNWTKHPTNPVLTSGATGTWDDYGVYSTHVIKDEGTYKMWYTGYSSTDTVFQIGYATSPDGINWTKDSNNPVLSVGASDTWDEDGVGGPTVIKDGTTYKMWYEGSDLQRWLRIGYATSPDGINWTKDPNNPVMSEGDWETFNEWGVAAPSVVKDGNIYHMLYIGIDTDYRYSIGHAYSSDGSNWTESPDNPQFSHNYGDGWDSWDVGQPTLFKDGNESVFKVFYRGQDESTWSIGYGVAASFEGGAVSTSTTTTISQTTSSTTTISPTTSTTTISMETTTTTIEDQPCPAELIYGEDSEELELLRIYRDEIMSQNPEGQEIIRLYYQLSPVIVKVMEEDEKFREEVKALAELFIVAIE